MLKISLIFYSNLATTVPIALYFQPFLSASERAKHAMQHCVLTTWRMRNIYFLFAA